MGASLSSHKKRKGKGLRAAFPGVKAPVTPKRFCEDVIEQDLVLACSGFKPALEDVECSICKDLVYKPVVNVCGHTFCFWCLHEAMGPGFSQAASCPLCRCPFTHMSRVAAVLHNVLRYWFPEEYKEREEETKVEEEKRKMFAPEPVGLPWPAKLVSDQGERAKLGVDGGGPCHGSFQMLMAKGSSFSLDENRAMVEHSCCRNPAQESYQGSKQGLQVLLQEGEGASAQPAAFSEASCSNSSQGISRQLTTRDFMCILCGGLLYQPVVLNCGHSYCLSCLEERYAPDEVSCLYCWKEHPEKGLSVCMLLDELVQKLFPTAYQRRKQVPQPRSKGSSRSKRSRPKPSSGPSSLEEERSRFVHFGIECDGCGVYPIVGQRFQCLDCQEEIGFDLCGKCYSMRQMPVRGPYLFNQRHTLEHRMLEVPQTPTFLHEVLAAHPELSVNTVLSMFMAMAEELESLEETEQRTDDSEETVGLTSEEVDLFTEQEEDVDVGTPMAEGENRELSRQSSASLSRNGAVVQGLGCEVNEGIVQVDEVVEGMAR